MLPQSRGMIVLIYQHLHVGVTWLEVPEKPQPTTTKGPPDRTPRKRRSDWAGPDRDWSDRDWVGGRKTMEDTRRRGDVVSSCLFLAG